jgi:hypothetical protein
VGIARDQALPEKGFQPLNVLAERGLAYTEALCGMGETHGLFQRNEAGKVLEIEHRYPASR